MTTDDKPDPARAARFVANLVVDAEAKRILSLSDEEFLAERKRKGRDLASTPSVEEFLEKVKALAARQQAPEPTVKKREPKGPDKPGQ
jgi:hypothetical protein